MKRDVGLGEAMIQVALSIYKFGVLRHLRNNRTCRRGISRADRRDLAMIYRILERITQDRDIIMSKWVDDDCRLDRNFLVKIRLYSENVVSPMK